MFKVWERIAKLPILQEKYIDSSFVVNTLVTVAPLTGRFNEKKIAPHAVLLTARPELSS